MDVPATCGKLRRAATTTPPVCAEPRLSTADVSTTEGSSGNADWRSGGGSCVVSSLLCARVLTSAFEMLPRSPGVCVSSNSEDERRRGHHVAGSVMTTVGQEGRHVGEMDATDYGVCSSSGIEKSNSNAVILDERMTEAVATVSKHDGVTVGCGSSSRLTGNGVIVRTEPCDQAAVLGQEDEVDADGFAGRICRGQGVAEQSNDMVNRDTVAGSPQAGVGREGATAERGGGGGGGGGRGRGGGGGKRSSEEMERDGGGEKEERATAHVAGSPKGGGGGYEGTSKQACQQRVGEVLDACGYDRSESDSVRECYRGGTGSEAVSDHVAESSPAMAVTVVRGGGAAEEESGVGGARVPSEEYLRNINLAQLPSFVNYTVYRQFPCFRRVCGAFAGTSSRSPMGVSGASRSWSLEDLHQLKNELGVMNGTAKKRKHAILCGLAILEGRPLPNEEEDAQVGDAQSQECRTSDTVAAVAAGRRGGQLPVENLPRAGSLVSDDRSMENGSGSEIAGEESGKGNGDVETTRQDSSVALQSSDGSALVQDPLSGLSHERNVDGHETVVNDSRGSGGEGCCMQCGAIMPASSQASVSCPACGAWQKIVKRKSGVKEKDRAKKRKERTNYVCSECESLGDLVHCSGPCLRAFHMSCLAVEDEPIVKASMATDKGVWQCHQCLNQRHQCFLCKNMDKDSAMRRCSGVACGKYYHEMCLRKLNLTKFDGPNRFYCPLHSCASCGESGRNKQSTRCVRCPTAYHLKCLPSRIPAGGYQVTKYRIVCGKHQEEKPSVERVKQIAQPIAKLGAADSTVTSGRRLPPKVAFKNGMDFGGFVAVQPSSGPCRNTSLASGSQHQSQEVTDHDGAMILMGLAGLLA
ncbi:hypothetical protein CBR_g5734 [Chara braunii]|uniref:PHD-type domain-containing protein n=1 Tax=Chara braunii TaxID=69332 RepID=A0A388KJF5_CHABU|nr:hypothetical protein CBR_g5734 [Chara braunii]|eukprot:GBG70103.1 hypothetical protein CBR_g5734 [Chara braunii]